MAKNDMRIPAAGGGLVSYFGESKSKVPISPYVVVVAIAVVIVVGYYLYKFV